MNTPNKPKLAYVIYKEDGEFVARIPILHISEFGATEAEALANLAEMETEVFEAEKAHGNKLPTYEESVAYIDDCKLEKPAKDV